MKKRNELKKIALWALALFALAGCSARSVEPAPEPPRCDLNAYAVCASIFENYLAAEAVRPAQAVPSTSPDLVPLVAPVTLPGGELAAEVDCYVNVDPDAAWLVYSHVAIPPSSPEAAEHLRSLDLCTDEQGQTRYGVGALQSLRRRMSRVSRGMATAIRRYGSAGSSQAA